MSCGRLSLVTAPTVEPITVATAKLFARVDISDDDALFATLIGAARLHGEVITHRQFVTATYDYTLDAFPGDYTPIELPRPPLQSVSSITYVDPDGDTQTLAATEYTVNTSGMFGQVYAAYNKSWPSTRDQLNAVTIRYVCGWPLTGGTTPTTPLAIQNWMLMRVSGLYEYRENMVIGQAANALPYSHIDGLLDPYRVPVL